MPLFSPEEVSGMCGWCALPARDTKNRCSVLSSFLLVIPDFYFWVAKVYEIDPATRFILGHLRQCCMSCNRNQTGGRQ